MTRLMTSIIALGFATTGAALASEHMTGEDSNTSGVISQENYDAALSADEIIEGDIYALDSYDEAAWEETDFFETVGTDWEEIGEVEDILMSRDGAMIGLVAEVGGWLDIGDSEVVLNMDDVKLANVGDGEYAFVTRLTQEELENQPEADQAWWQ